MKTLLVLPAIVIGAASLVFSAGAIAESRDITSSNPVTGLVNATGHALYAVGHGTVNAVTGVAYGTGKVVKGAVHGTEHAIKKVTQ